MATVKEKEVTLEVLAGLIASGKATPADLVRMSEMLAVSVDEHKKNAFQAKVDAVKAVMEEQGITLKELNDALKEPMQPIFIWVDEHNVKHEKYGNEKGKPAAWIGEMKTKVTKAKALELALTDSGKAWVEKIYS